MARKQKGGATSSVVRPMTITTTAAAAMGPAQLVEPAAADVDPELRRHMIAERAYYLAAARGFAAGGELGDWVTAEREIDARLAGSAPN